MSFLCAHTFWRLTSRTVVMFFEHRLLRWWKLISKTLTPHNRPLTPHKATLRLAFDVFGSAKIVRDIMAEETDKVRRGLQSKDDIDHAKLEQQHVLFENLDLIELFSKELRNRWFERETFEGGILSLRAREANL